MAERPLGVGIIGVSASRGWAAAAHIPALRALPEYELRAVSSRTEAAARQAAKAYGVPATTRHEELVARPDIDLVAVTVKAPEHRTLVLAALAAGKAVFCEWPLGRDLEDARTMQRVATARGAVTAVGLQARQAPETAFVRELLADGYVGEVLSTSVLGTSFMGNRIPLANRYTLDRSSGANLGTISLGHTVDLLNVILGEFAQVSAVEALRLPTTTIAETGETQPRTAPDQVGVVATLTSGAVATIHLREAVAGGTGFIFEINGDRGTLRLTAAAANPQIFPITVWGGPGPDALVKLDVPQSLAERWPAVAALRGTPAYNVGRAYAAFAAGWVSGAREVPDFADALHRHGVLEEIAVAARSGERRTLVPRPHVGG